MERIEIENRLPLYQIQFDNEFDEISLVLGDFSTQSLYCCSESQLVHRWTFMPPGLIARNQGSRFRSLFDQIPRCERYQSRPTDTAPTPISICLKRASSFEALTAPVVSRPLASITNWFQTTAAPSESGSQKRFKSSNGMTHTGTPENGGQDENRRVESASTGVTKAKGASRLKNGSRKSRRNLFHNCRKISDFFLTP